MLNSGTRVELDPDGCRVVRLATACDLPVVCPSCRTPSASPRGWVTTRPRDLPGPTPARLEWRKRRWRCRQPGCPRASFTESIPQLPLRARITARLRAAAGQAVAVGGATITQAARDLELSWPVVAAAFAERATALLPPAPEPVRVLEIDNL
jgi:transposase